MENAVEDSTPFSYLLQDESYSNLSGFKKFLSEMYFSGSIGIFEEVEKFRGLLKDSVNKVTPAIYKKEKIEIKVGGRAADKKKSGGRGSMLSSRFGFIFFGVFY